MGDLRIRDVEADVLLVIRAMARRHHLSTEQFLRGELAAIAEREKRAFLDRLRLTREALRHKYGEAPDSTPGIRAERDAR